MTTINQSNSTSTASDEQLAALKREVSSLRNPTSVLPMLWQVWLWTSVATATLSTLSVLSQISN